MHLVDDED